MRIMKKHLIILIMVDKGQNLGTTSFNVGTRYEMKKLIGSGAYG